MTINKNLFTEKELNLLKKHGVVFIDNYDYSEDELDDIGDKIEDLMLVRGFDLKGQPTSECKTWERIFDTFQDNYDKG